jgi:hypothetical protein
MKSKITYENFAEKLIKEIPELKETYNDNLDDNGKILNHTFLGDIFWDMERTIIQNTPKYTTRLMNFLDEAMTSSDEKIQELIAVSFVEYLIVTNSASLRLIEFFLGPNLKKELKSMREWKPTYTCPVCGYSGLEKPSHNRWGDGSQDICDCCGTEFGYEDAVRDKLKDYPKRWEGLRNKWINNSAKWFNPKMKPKNWKLQNQLNNLKKLNIKFGKYE